MIRQQSDQFHNVGIMVVPGSMGGTKKKHLNDNTEKKLINLKPFKPGQSGNAKGRPKGARSRLGTQFLEFIEADFNRFWCLFTPS